MIALLNLSVLGFIFVFHDKAKRTQQGNLLEQGKTQTGRNETEICASVPLPPTRQLRLLRYNERQAEQTKQSSFLVALLLNAARFVAVGELRESRGTTRGHLAHSYSHGI